MVYYAEDTKSALRDDDGRVASMSHDLIYYCFSFHASAASLEGNCPSCLYPWFALCFTASSR